MRRARIGTEKAEEKVIKEKLQTSSQISFFMILMNLTITELSTYKESSYRLWQQETEEESKLPNNRLWWLTWLILEINNKPLIHFNPSGNSHAQNLPKFALSSSLLFFLFLFFDKLLGFHYHFTFYTNQGGVTYLYL